MRTSLSTLAIIPLALALVASPAAAQDREAARKHFDAGLSLMKVEDFAGASAEFEASMAAAPTKNALFNLANCYHALHRYAEALAAFDRLEAEFGPTLDAGMRSAMEAHEAEIRSLVATLEVRVSVDHALVELDGKPVGRSPLAKPLVLGPGDHTLRATLQGYDAAESTMSLVSGSSTRIDLSLAKTPVQQAPAPGAIRFTGAGASLTVTTSVLQDTLRWGGVAGTAAFAVTTGVFLGLAYSRYDDFQGYNDQVAQGDRPRNDPSLLSARDDTELYRNLAIGFGVATGALAVATVVLWLVDLDTEVGTPSAAAVPGGIHVAF